MSEIEECTAYLIELVQKSKEYHKYQQLLNQIMEDTTLYNKVNEFRKKSISIQLNVSNNLLDISNALYLENNTLLNNPLVADFLSAEQGYCRLIRKMNDQIMENLDLEIDFLED